ncbi:MAG: ferrous iron transporter B [Dehalococcoidia bacterium]|nr:ferrous iron transporter B [Dehalococcoidia bacterium]RLC63907.1 MAG: ferrous iron transporter B [Chloroflexota bacterium]
MMRILLMGNPNVGKSALFSRLTGTHIIASNYPGTTVGFTKGYLKLGEEQAEIIDVPGSYTLEPGSKAEEVAVEMLKKGDLVINVVDATNLERNLNLTLQLLERQTPVIVALNMWDDTRHRGVNIDVAKLEELLGVPVVPTVGVTGQRISELVRRLPEAKVPENARTYSNSEERWARVGDIVSQVQSLSHRHHRWYERLEDASSHRVSGIFIALLVLFATFWFVRFVGEGIINYAAGPLFEWLWTPLLAKLSLVLGSGGFWHNILIGNLIGGGIDYFQSFGLLSTGLYIPLAAVLPYIVAFYLALGILEDIGYLPRLAVLMDTIMHRLGLHGYAIIPTILGLGCNVPGIMATRILESRKQRFIAATLISIAVPCAALQAMIIGLVGQEGVEYVALIYGSLFISWVIIGLILNRAAKGFNPELLVEIPPYRLPPWRVIGEKLWLRVSGFLKEALPIVLGAVLVVNILYILGVFNAIANVTAPVLTELWGLPKETITALAVGFLRKDAAMGMLVPLALTAKQLVISSTVLAMFFPCVATFVILARELGVRDLLKSVGIMIAAALIMGGLQNLVL